MIGAQEAVKLARQSFEEIYQSHGVSEVLLEEINASEDGSCWLVTYSFYWQPASGSVSIGPGDRINKVLVLDGETGRLLCMKSPTGR